MLCVMDGPAPGVNEGQSLANEVFLEDFCLWAPHHLTNVCTLLFYLTGNLSLL